MGTDHRFQAVLRVALLVVHEADPVVDLIIVALLVAELRLLGAPHILQRSVLPSVGWL